MKKQDPINHNLICYPKPLSRRNRKEEPMLPAKRRPPIPAVPAAAAYTAQGKVIYAIRWRCEKMQIPCINTAATGRNIDRLRIRAGMTVRDLQTAFGFSTPQAIYKWIRGDAMPSLDNLVILSSLLGVTMDEIVVVGSAARKCG